MNDIQAPIMEYIAIVVEEAGGAPVAVDTPLLMAGVFDSINLVRLVQFLEERFGIQIPEADVVPELFETPASLTAYVASRLR